MANRTTENIRKESKERNRVTIGLTPGRTDTKSALKIQHSNLK